MLYQFGFMCTRRWIEEIFIKTYSYKKNIELTSICPLEKNETSVFYQDVYCLKRVIEDCNQMQSTGGHDSPRDIFEVKGIRISNNSGIKQKWRMTLKVDP